MEQWVGPAIIAALVSALVSAAGWFVSSWQAQRLDQRRRDEKVNDFQVALRAEIASDLLNLQVTVNRGEMFEIVKQAFADDPSYQPFVPQLAQNVVFQQVVREIHVLPGPVIASVIGYSGLRQSIEHIIGDLRTAIREKLPANRQLLMISDYFDMLVRLENLAAKAVATLDASLVNKSDAVPLIPGSASGPERDDLKASAEQKAWP